MANWVEGKLKIRGKPYGVADFLGFKLNDKEDTE